MFAISNRSTVAGILLLALAVRLVGGLLVAIALAGRPAILFRGQRNILATG